MKDRNDRRWLIAGIIIFVFMIFCINTAYADSNLNKTDGQIKSQNDVIDFIDGFTGDATFSMNAEKITVDTLTVDSVFSFSGAISVGATTITGNATVSGTVQGEQLTSTDDATITDDIGIGGDATVTGTVQGEHLYITDDAVIADSLYIGDDLVVIDDITADSIYAASGILTVTMNTGQGNNELYDMDQNVLTTSDITIDSLLVSDDLIVTEKLGFAAIQTITLGVGATTFAITTNNITLTGDGGANVLGTITAAEIGIYIIEFVDANITVTDTDAHTADTIDLLGTAIDLTSADDTILMLYYNGVSFLEVSRSVN